MYNGKDIGGLGHFCFLRKWQRAEVVVFQSLSLILFDPMEWSMTGFPVLHYLPEFAQTHVHWVSDASKHLILSCSLLLLPSIFPNIRVFSSESVFHIRWPKYWSFSFNISPSNEYSRLISFRIEQFYLIVVHGQGKMILHYVTCPSIYKVLDWALGI